jgi:hypothetical protein
VRRGPSICFGWRALELRGWEERGRACFDEQGCPLPPERLTLLLPVPKKRLTSVARDVPAAQGRGRALAATAGVLAGIPRPLSRCCGALGAAVEGDSLFASAVVEMGSATGAGPGTLQSALINY